ncbi:DNA topoisomerase 2 [Pyrenophora tritici-repentis]|nr:DNA topoisomerase 2 [Pyrenophora tritici-repentis]KAI1534352.1 GyrB Type IIA topoisomerase DNA gyrase topo II topoisomerase IV B subunit [Pyrenophora tritici-repentis]KAI1568521.1 GyrB Type IIA topoisomerase DNA gyrase topo II topoisomerase IV B subunit [Pyrenophora tritici-repentis]KAI1575862.1 GyrB Type IIA topoisomerase DNA gyrase topo II topoisomerase IV B subunit [Pyrenophora tritici-repentis]KAI1602595.1 GyrB Type IIA topoisomerase DNA gyrase topo II topoisomerase IV B subunit [Pyrenop
MHDVLDDVGLCDGVQELVAQDRLATELTGPGGELLLRLGGKGRIDDGTVDEKEQMVLDLRGLELDSSLVLLVYDGHELFDNLIGNVVHMRTTGRCGDRVDERDLVERTI